MNSSSGFFFLFYAKQNQLMQYFGDMIAKSFLASGGVPPRQLR